MLTNTWQIKIKGNATITAPADIYSMTTYVLLEQEDWFEDEMQLVRRITKPGMNCLDIGACYGVYALTMAQAVGPEGKVYAFEPNPEVTEHLRSAKPDNLEVIPKALSNKPGMASLSKDIPELCKSYKGRDIEQITLDEWWESEGRPDIDIIKLDVNGNEPQILQGGEDMLQHTSPLIIVATSQLKDSMVALESLGYSINRYLPGQDILASYAPELKDPYCLNIVAAKTETIEKFKLLQPVSVQEFCDWQSYLSSLPWTKDLLPKWKNSDHADYLTALDYLCSGDPDQAMTILSSLHDPDNALNSLSITLARAHYLLGQRKESVELLLKLARAIMYDQPLDLSLPFLLPLPCQDGLPCQNNHMAWIKARCMEAFIQLNAFSSMFSGKNEFQFLKTLHSNSERNIEAERRLALCAMRLGKNIKIRPESRLLSDEHLNADVWRNIGGLATEPEIQSVKQESPKILILSTLQGAGAGVAAYRLHTGLRANNVYSTMCVVNKVTNDPTVKQLQWVKDGRPVNVWAYLRIKWADTLKRYPNKAVNMRFFSTPDSIIPLEKYVTDYDVINLHWIAGLMDIKSMPGLLAGKKIIWTLHDMNPFTGGCHYAKDCTRYETGCYACPQLGPDGPEDIVRKIWEIKAESYDQLNLTVVTPSKWLGECSRKSALLGRFPHEVIPYGLDLEQFVPVDKIQARRKLRLPEDKKIILFGAFDIYEHRKGFDLFLDAIHRLPHIFEDTDIELVAFGESGEISQIKTPYKLHEIGYLDTPAELSTAYSAADVYVLPTREDNLPNTCLESLACGTPVAGFEVGGLPDMIVHKETGYVAPFPDVQELAQGIKWVLGQNASKFRENCRNRAVQNYALDIQAKRYCQLYQSNNVSQQYENTFQKHKLTDKDKPSLLNLGCGRRFHPAWTNVDFTSTAPNVIAHDLTKGLPFETSSFDVVYHSHLLEHFSKKYAPAFMKECFRVLKPGGIIRVAVPDLEAIVRHYLSLLEKSLEGDEASQKKYEWILLELFDQMVRNKSGGEMFTYWRQNPMPAEDFVIERFGSEVKGVLQSIRSSGRDNPPASQIASDEPSNPLQIGKFRMSGEIHQWMYDRYSLDLLLSAAEFQDIKKCEATESSIANFNDYLLDIEPDGSVRKPDSLFMEATKK